MSNNEPRVETAKVAVPEAAVQKDYQFLIEENMELLRKVNTLGGMCLKHAGVVQDLERKVSERDLQLAKSKAFVKGRRLTMGLHVVLSIVAGASGVVLWLKHLAPAEACWTVLGGIVWFAVASICIHQLAEGE